MSGRIVPTPHADRASCPPWLMWSLTIAVGVVLAVAVQAAFATRLPPTSGHLLGFGLGLLAMIGLPSLSLRLLARVLLFVSALGLVRFSLISGSIATGGQGLLLWLVAAVFVLVLSDRVGTEADAPLGGPGASVAPRPWTTIRSAGAVAAVVLLAAVVLAPVLLPYVGNAVEPGEGATLDPTASESSILRATDSLDMTSRPELTDEVVFTVDTDRATFWRGQTFDVWDGSHWTRSDDRFVPLASLDTPQLADDDLGARGSDVVEQRFRLEAPYSDVVYAVPTAVQIDIDRPVRQRADGTLQSAPLGRGATYSVTSRRIPLSAERLRSVDGDIPESVRAQYAAAPVATERVLAAATEVTAGATTQYDKILALQAWMGDRVEYALDAPLAPRGVDVVDHFLFEAEQGWCEQIASSLVVLARANGIPARLVSGYVPGDQDPVTGQFTVRQRDAHAWAEVWFPEVGWVPFDPTADVPLAGDDRSEPTIGEWLQDHLVVIGLCVGAVVLLAGPVRLLLRRTRARRAARPVGWSAVADRRLDDLGARVGRRRGGHETASAYADVLAQRYGDERLVRAGRLIDDATYAQHPPDPVRQAEVDAVLAEVAARPVPDPDDAAVPAGAG
ncbi:transglutaminaseTgpA domain-containing protein [Aquihabitans daechungensis]|uniref:transglutaminase family protein n=1 Tax=Aquihabitans daechungensis TaxID=1052257 RepID=UPI003B9F7C96